MTIAVGTSNNNSGDIQNITCSITGAAATNRAALIAVMNDGIAPSSVTFGASACSFLASMGRIHFYGIIGQPSGAQVVTANQGAQQQTIIAVAQFTSPTGALSFGTPVTVTNTEQTAISASVTSAAGQLVVDCAMLITDSMAVGADQTAIINLPTGGAPPTGHDAGYLAFGMSYQAGSTTTEMSWTATETLGDNDIIALAISEAGGTPGPTISDVDSDESISSTQTGWIITGTGFSSAAVEIRQGSTVVSQTINSQTSTTINCSTVFSAGAGPHLRYGSATAAAINGDDQEATIAISVAAPSDRAFVNIATPNTTAANRITATPDLAAGDQLEISNVVGGTIADVTVNADGTFDCAVAVTAFDVRVWAASDSTWGTVATQTVGGADETPDSFTFTDQTNVGPSQQITSSLITVAGLTTGVSVAVTVSGGGTYSKNGGAYTSAAGTAVNGDTFRVRHTSSASFSGVTNTTLTIGGVSDTFTSTTGAEDTTPTAFVFTDQSGVALSTTVTSNATTVSGINSTTPISIVGGLYEKNSSGTWTAAAGTVVNGDTVRVRHTASADFSTPTNTTLTIGGVSDTFTSTTFAEDATPSAFMFADQTSVTPSAVVTSNAITVSGINAPASMLVVGGEWEKNASGSWSSSSGSVVNGDTVRVRHTTSALFLTATNTTLTIGGVSDTFTTTTLAADTTPDAFAFFDQSGVARGTVITSNAITVQGINAAAAVSTTGGEWEKNGSGFWTTEPGNAVNGDTVRVRHTSSSAYFATASTVLTIGGVSDTFTSTTVAEVPGDTTPDPFGFNSQSSVALSVTVTSNPIAVAGINAAAAVTIMGGEWQRNGGSWSAAPSAVVENDIVRVRHASSGNFSASTQTVLTIGGVSGTFTSTTVAAVPGGGGVSDDYLHGISILEMEAGALRNKPTR